MVAACLTEGENLGNTCSEEYAGPYPFSEPEVVAVRDFISWEVPQLELYMTLHSYGQILLYPWSYSKEKSKKHNQQVC